MRNATSVVIYPNDETRFYVFPVTGKYCRVEIDSVAAIQVSDWRHLQRLVDALTQAIEQTKAVESVDEVSA